MKKYISNLLSANPLCGISTYIDTLNLSSGIVTRRVVKYILKGDENWGVDNEGASNAFFRWYIGGGYVQESEISSHFISTTITSGTTAIGVMMTSGGTLRIRTDNVSAMTLSDFKTWLANQYANDTPVTVWCVLSTTDTDTITVPTGLTGTVDGYLTQTGTPTPTSPIYPTANPVTMWANYTPNIYNSGWTVASGQPNKYNGGWT